MRKRRLIGGRRLGDDVEIAVEAMLGGRHSVVLNVMRDHMELQMLLGDFTASPERIVEWLGCTPKVRRTRFAPSAVRRRVADWVFPDQNVELPDTHEYHVHCLATHPTPEIVGTEKLAEDTDAFHLQIEMGEIVEHLGRVAYAADDLMKKVGLGEDSRPPGVNSVGALLHARTFAFEFSKSVVDAGLSPVREPVPRTNRKARRQAPAGDKKRGRKRTT